MAALFGCFPGKILWCGASAGNAFRGIVKLFSNGLGFTPLEFDTADPDPDWVATTGSRGLLGSTFTGLLKLSAKIHQTL